MKKFNLSTIQKLLFSTIFILGPFFGKGQCNANIITNMDTVSGFNVNFKITGNFTFGALSMSFKMNKCHYYANTYPSVTLGTKFSSRGYYVDTFSYIYDTISDSAQGFIGIYWSSTDSVSLTSAQDTLVRIHFGSHTGSPSDTVSFEVENLNVFSYNYACYVTFMYNGNPRTVLPVKLIYFTTKADGNDALLQWSTATEKNNDHFDVERSSDRVNFMKVGEVKGNGNTMNLISYNFVDKNIAESGSKILYYRLKQVDYNGKFEFSKIQTVTLKKGSVKVFPNPVTSKLTIENSSVNDEVKIVNTIGQLMYAGYDKEIDFSKFSPGIYFLCVKNDVIKLIKN